jgi:hypothetical protein
VGAYGASAYPYQATKPVGGLRDPQRVYSSDRWVVSGTPVYESRFKSTDAAIIARPTSASSLSSALSGASSGDIIWIPGTASFALGSKKSVKAGVILASDRGQDGSKGALLTASTSAFSVGDDVTFSGLRIIAASSMRTSSGSGIDAIGVRGLEVENCEIGNFGYWCVNLKDESMAWDSPNRHYIHHSLIYGAQKSGYGYGVEIWNTSAYIEACILINCRHLIASQRTQSYNTILSNYEAAYNIAFETWYLHSTGSWMHNVQFDQHGGNDSTSWGNPESPSTSQWAGGTLKIHHNSFHDNGPDHANVGIRGIPKNSIDVYNNWTSLKHGGSSGVFGETNPANPAFEQQLNHLTGKSLDGKTITGTSFIRMTVRDNQYVEGGESPLRQLAVTVDVKERS